MLLRNELRAAQEELAALFISSMISVVFLQSPLRYAHLATSMAPQTPCLAPVA